MKKGKTLRGFTIYTFSDFHQNECSLQKSSRADKDEIWLGLAGDEMKMHPVFNVPLGMRMAIDRKLAKKLAKKLLIFAETGEI